MTAVNPEASRQAVVEAALVLLERMGLTPADLAAAPPPCKQVPTFAEYVPVVSAARQCRDPPGVRLVLEPGRRPLGWPPPGRADPVGDPAIDGLRQDPRGGPP